MACQKHVIFRVCTGRFKLLTTEMILNILSLCNAGDFGDNDVILGLHMAARLF